jgi:hypothetical protein
VFPFTSKGVPFVLKPFGFAPKAVAFVLEEEKLP